MDLHRYTVVICEQVEATTPEHAAREIAWKLIRWDEDKYGPLRLIVTDEAGQSRTLTHDDYAPVFVWEQDGSGGIQ